MEIFAYFTTFSIAILIPQAFNPHVVIIILLNKAN